MTFKSDIQISTELEGRLLSIYILYSWAKPGLFALIYKLFFILILNKLLNFTLKQHFSTRTSISIYQKFSEVAIITLLWRKKKWQLFNQSDTEDQLVVDQEKKVPIEIFFLRLQILKTIHYSVLHANISGLTKENTMLVREFIPFLLKIFFIIDYSL